MSADMRPSAKIYQFPRKAQASFAVSNRRATAPANTQFQAAPAVEYGSGWYHEAAIEAERPRKH
jgi:Protein of unknown function (DUF2735)